MRAVIKSSAKLIREIAEWNRRWLYLDSTHRGVKTRNRLFSTAIFKSAVFARRLRMWKRRTLPSPLCSLLAPCIFQVIPFTNNDSGGRQQERRHLRSAQPAPATNQNLTGRRVHPETYTVQVDKRETIRWPHKTPVLIGGLDLHDNHLVVLTSDGKPVVPLQILRLP